MSELPKLRIKTWSCGYEYEEIRDFEEAGEFLNYNSDTMISVEGKLLSCYDELVRLASSESFRNKEFLEVVILPLMSGG